MTEWNHDVIDDLARASDLFVSPLRRDGETYRTPTQIWSVVVDGELYVRAYNGPDASWYRVARAQGRGRIESGGHTLGVRFEPGDPSLTAQIDAAYEKKYGRSSYLRPMLAAGAQEATLRIVPDGE